VLPAAAGTDAGAHGHVAAAHDTVDKHDAGDYNDCVDFNDKHIDCVDFNDKHIDYLDNELAADDSGAVADLSDRHLLSSGRPLLSRRNG
jgi:hypothetical protein